MWVTIGGDATKSVRNAGLLVIMRVRLLQKIGLLDLTNWTLFKKIKRLETTYKKCMRLLGNAVNATYAIYLLRAHKF